MKNRIYILFLSWFFLLSLFGYSVYAQPPVQITQSKFLGYAPDRVLVAFEEGTRSVEKKALHAQVGASVLKTIPALGVDVVQVPAGTVLDKVNLYGKNPNISYAEPDYYRLFWIPQEGSEPDLGVADMFSQQWGLNNTGQTFIGCDPSWGFCGPYWYGTPDADIDAPEAWDKGRSKLSIKIAILDTGVDWTSMDLKNKYITSDEKNFLVSYPEATDMKDNIGHGTHVAGIAAAECDNDQGIAGTACDASIVSLKVCYRYVSNDALNGAGVCPTSAVASALNHAANPDGNLNTDDHLDIVNMSFGTDTIVNGVWVGLQGYSQTEADAVKKAWDAGVVLVAAAGNDGTTSKNYPAAYPEVIAVGATDEDDKITTFSNFGTDWVSIGAPGSNIWSLFPNVQCGLNANSIEACLNVLSGTSMASPYVAGAAAVILGYIIDNGLVIDPLKINSQVRCHIEKGGDGILLQSFKYGRLNLDKSLQFIDSCENSSSNVVPPPAPSGLSATNQYSGSGKNKKFSGVKLQWTNNWTNNANKAASNIVEYCNASVTTQKRQKIYTCSNDWVERRSVDGSLTYYFDDKSMMASNTPYLYRVKAKNSAGESTYSNEAGVSVPAF